MKISFTYLNTRRTLSAILAFLITAICQQAVAQTDVKWNFGVGAGSLAASSGTPISNLTVSAFTLGNSFGTVATPNGNTNPSSGYTGATGNYNYGNAARIGGTINTSTPSGSAYFEFTVTPATGYSVEISKIEFGTRITNGGPGNYSVRTSLDNYATSIASGTNSTTWALKSHTGLNITSGTGAAITIRIYAYNLKSATSGAINWQIDDALATVKATFTPNYRTKAAGNFSSASTWEYNSTGATWVSAAAAPTNKNNITIRHAVALDQNFSVAASKTFTITAGSFTINSGKTFDVALGGTANFGANAVTVKSTASGSGSIGKILGSLTGATNVTVERYIPANNSRAWRLLAVPTTGSQTIYQAWQENGSPFVSNGLGTLITKPGANQATNGYDTISSSASILDYYNQSNNTWSNTIASTNTTAIETDGAYFLFVRGDRGKRVSSNNSDVNATTLRTNGTIKQGTLTSATIGTGLYAPLGNPYASAIAFDKPVRTGGIDDTYYIWDAKLIQGASLGAYQTFTAANGYVPTPGGGSYSGASTTIEAGQAFFVHATDAGEVIFDENAKVASTTNLGFRPATSLDASQMVKLTTKLFASDNMLLDGNDIVFDSRYDNGVNSDDAYKLSNPIENIGIAKGKQLLAVEARQPVADKDEIQFGLSNLKQQTYKLQITPQNLVVDGLVATLEDSYKKTSTVLNLSDVNELQFSVDANPASAAANRFKVMFKAAPVIAPVVDVKPAITVAPNPVQGSFMNVQFAGKAAGNYSLRLLNNAGQILMSQTVQHAGSSMYNHAVTLPSGIKAGTYQLEVVSPDKTRSVQKVLVVN